MPELRRTEHHPVRIVRSVADSTAFQGWRMEPSEPIEALYASSLKQRRKVIVDMGEHMTGYFSLRVNHTGMPADAPIRLRITFAEVPAELNTPFDPYPGGLSRAWLQDETVTVMRLPATVRIERRVACRYVMIEVLAQSSFDFRVEDITLEAVTSASGEAPALAEGTDPMIRRIYDTGLKTLSECMQTVYEDGPKRDQRLWIGDLYLESLANYLLVRQPCADTTLPSIFWRRLPTRTGGCTLPCTNTRSPSRSTINIRWITASCTAWRCSNI